MIIDPENVPRRTASIYPDQFKVNKIKRRVGTAHQNLVIPIPKMIATNEYLGRGKGFTHWCQIKVKLLTKRSFQTFLVTTLSVGMHSVRLCLLTLEAEPSRTALLSLCLVTRNAWIFKAYSLS